MEKFSSEYWNQHYLENRTGWDIGNISTPIKEYIDQLSSKSMKLLVPGAGNAYEVEYLFEEGFKNIYLLDFSEKSIDNFLKRCPDFPVDYIIKSDFFKHQDNYDLILEQTFFSSLPIALRNQYAKQIFNLLKPGGKYIGLLFNHHFNFDGPPFGGSFEEYHHLFGKYFSIEIMETAYNSIKPRNGREFFVKLKKKEDN